MRAGNRLLGQSTVDLLHWNLETPPQFPPISVLVVEYGLPMEKKNAPGAHQETHYACDSHGARLFLKLGCASVDGS